MAKLLGAPFIKVEATKFTEVGYVGRDVDSIIRDLTETAFKMYKQQGRKRYYAKARQLALERILDILLPTFAGKSILANNTSVEDDDKVDEDSSSESSTKDIFRKKLLNGELDDQEIELDITTSKSVGVLFGPPGLEELTNQIQNMFSSTDDKKKKRMKVVDAIFCPY